MLINLMVASASVFEGGDVVWHRNIAWEIVNGGGALVGAKV